MTSSATLTDHLHTLSVALGARAAHECHLERLGRELAGVFTQARGRTPRRSMSPYPADTPPVLALRALGLGDLLTGVPALRGLRRTFPSANAAQTLVLAADPPDACWARTWR